MRGSLGPDRLLTRILTGLGALVFVSAGGCGFGASGHDAFTAAAVELIEGELARQIALGPLAASCSQGGSLAAGDAFDCTATDDDERELRFAASVDPDGQGVRVRSINLILAGQLDAIEQAASQRITANTGIAVGAGDLDCGGVTVIATDGDVLDCTVRDPADGVRYQASVHLHDVDALIVDVTIGDRVR